MEQKNVCKYQFFKTFATPAFMTLISDNKNRFCTNDQPAEGTSDPAFIQRPVSAYTWIFLFLRS